MQEYTSAKLLRKRVDRTQNHDVQRMINAPAFRWPALTLRRYGNSARLRAHYGSARTGVSRRCRPASIYAKEICSALACEKTQTWKAEPSDCPPTNVRKRVPELYYKREHNVHSRSTDGLVK